jgi:hypothetical protein
MASSSPGSRLSYDVTVGDGGQILLSWLKSKFYNLGEARVILDDQRPGLKISGHWEYVLPCTAPTWSLAYVRFLTTDLDGALVFLQSCSKAFPPEFIP